MISNISQTAIHNFNKAEKPGRLIKNKTWLSKVELDDKTDLITEKVFDPEEDKFTDKIKYMILEMDLGPTQTYNVGRVFRYKLKLEDGKFTFINAYIRGMKYDGSGDKWDFTVDRVDKTSKEEIILPRLAKIREDQQEKGNKDIVTVLNYVIDGTEMLK
ncbi:MAG: hypothetical protein ABIH00_01975 [Armatimonadota bacterium]